MKVLALIPAHDEAATVEASIAGLQSQARPPDRIVVITDNCTDDTASIAQAAGAEVFATVNNTEKKGGALNQALSHYLPAADDNDVVLVQDADSVLSPVWLQTALPLLDRSDVGAIGGIFYTPHDHRMGLIGALQRMEYVRYARQIARKGCKAYVLTGTATALRVRVLREIVAAYANGRLPGGTPGRDTYYVEAAVSVTEDSYMTLAVKTLGYKTLSPMDCWVCTEVMPTWRQLWHQRSRWQRGALENIKHFGITRVTLSYALRQLGSLLEIAVFVLFLSLTAWSICAGVFHVVPFWLGITAIFLLERIVSVRKAGFKSMLLAAPMVVETLFGLWKQVVNLKCIGDILMSRKADW